MTWNKELWLELIQNDEKVAFLIPLWKLYIEKKLKRDLTWEYYIKKFIQKNLTIADILYVFQPDLRFHKTEIITISELNLNEIIELLPVRNILFLLEDQEIFDLLMQTIGFNQKCFIRSIMGDQIRVWNHPKRESRKPSSIRKYWYRIFKPKLQRIYQIAYEKGKYKYNVLLEPNFYDNLPRLISTMIQYWATNQVKNPDGIFELAKIQREVVVDYSAMGIKDKSRKRDWINRKISLKYILEYFKQFKDINEFKEKTEKEFDVLITTYRSLDEVISVIEKEIEIEENEEENDFYILCLVEKDADYEEVLSMGTMMGISVLSAHGQNALASLESFIVNHMKKNSKVIFLSITDCDPTGFQIARAFAQSQPIKLSIQPIMWIHSHFWNKLTIEERREQCYIPKQVAKKKKTKLVQWWIDNRAYDIDKDVFGGGRFGYEIEAIDDKVFGLAVKDLFYSIGINALAILETMKDENREDIDKCSKVIAEEWFEDQESELKEELKRFENLVKEVRIPINNVLGGFYNIRDQIVDDIAEKVKPKGEEIASEDDFDDRDAEQYVDSFEEELLMGKDYWIGKYTADVCESEILDNKLKDELRGVRDDIIDIDLDNYEIPSVNKDELREEITEIVQNFDFGVGENELPMEKTIEEDELENQYWDVCQRIGWFSDKRYIKCFNMMDKEEVLELIKKTNMNFDEIVKEIKKRFEVDVD